MISVILPAYNEAKRLERSVETLAKYLQDNFSEFEIIIAEDGSTDGTDEIA
ncbi:glycosyltransferase, partial [Geoglobus ahangari]